MKEFEVASHRNVILEKKRLILAVLDRSVLNEERLSASLQQHRSSHTLIDCNKADFRDRLLYFMPADKLGITGSDSDTRL